MEEHPLSGVVGARGGKEREREKERKNSDPVTHLVGSKFLAKGTILLIILLLNSICF